MQCRCYSERSKSITTQGSPAFQCLWRLKGGVKKRVTPRVNNLFLTRDGKTQLLPVAPDVSSPHSREASNAGKGGAGQDEGPLAPDLYKGTKDSRVFPNLEIILWQYVTLKCLQETLPLPGLTCRWRRPPSVHTCCASCSGWTPSAALSCTESWSSAGLRQLLFKCGSRTNKLDVRKIFSCIRMLPFTPVAQTHYSRLSLSLQTQDSVIQSIRQSFSILSKFTKWILEMVKKTKTNVMFGLRPQLPCTYLACMAASQDRCRDSCPLSHPQSWKVHSYPGWSSRVKQQIIQLFLMWH